MAAKQKVKVTTTKTQTRTRTRSKKDTKPKGGRKRCPHCGRYY